MVEHKHYGSGSRAKYFKENVPMNVNEAKKLQMKKMTEELRDEEILELRRAAGRI